MSRIKNLCIVGTDKIAGHSNAKDAWSKIEYFDQIATVHQKYASIERVLTQWLKYCRGFGKPSEEGIESYFQNSIFILELPHPDNKTIWVEDFGCYVNFCGETGDMYIEDDEYRENTPGWFFDQIQEQKEKLKLYEELQPNREKNNLRATVSNVFSCYLQCMRSQGQIIALERSHCPAYDTLRQVSEEYLITGNHWYGPTVERVIKENNFEQPFAENNILTDEVYSKYVNKVSKNMRKLGFFDY